MQRHGAEARALLGSEQLRLRGAVPPGVGKTHLAIALGREAILGGYAVQCVTAATLVASMAKAHSERRLADRLMGLAKPKLLIVEELGYLPLEPDAAHLFFQLVSRRYEKRWARCSAMPSSPPPSSTGCRTTATSSPFAATATACARNNAVDFCRRALRHNQPAPSRHDDQGVSSSCRLDAIPHDAHCGRVKRQSDLLGQAPTFLRHRRKITAPQAVVTTDKWRLGRGRRGELDEAKKLAPSLSYRVATRRTASAC